MWRTGKYKRAHLRPALTLHLARSERGSRWGAAVFKRPLQTRASPRSPCLLPHQTHGLLWVRPTFLEGKRQETLFDNGISFNQPCHGETPKRRRGREQTKVGGQRGRPGALRPALHRGTSCICETDEPVSSASVSAVSPVVGIQSDRPTDKQRREPGDQGEFCTVG